MQESRHVLEKVTLKGQEGRLVLEKATLKVQESRHVLEKVTLKIPTCIFPLKDLSKRIGIPYKKALSLHVPIIFL